MGSNGLVNSEDKNIKQSDTQQPDKSNIDDAKAIRSTRLFKGGVPSILFFVTLMLVVLLSLGSRYMQVADGWLEIPEIYYSSKGVPMVSSLDVYKWVRIAEMHDNGEYLGEGLSDIDELAYFPDGHKKEKQIPLLSYLLSIFAKLFNVDYISAGMFLIPILASLFIIPLGIYFNRLGYPLAGILGGFFGTFSTMYYMRTTVGRIDTDSLMLFFMVVPALFILLASEAKRDKVTYIYSALSGLSLMLFIWWYNHMEFMIAFFFVLILSLILAKKGVKSIVISSALFLLFSKPTGLQEGLIAVSQRVTNYLLPNKTVATIGKAHFPNVYDTVTEVISLSPVESVSKFFIHPVLFIIAMVAVGVLVVKHPRQMLPLAPLFGLGLLGITSLNRLVLFLFPFMGIGLGFIVNYAVNKVSLKKSASNDSKDLVSVIAGYSIVLLIIVSMSLINNLNGFMFYRVPYISIQSTDYDSFHTIEEALPKDSALYTWWDNGLAIAAETGMATYHDGMSQNTSKTWLIAKSLIGPQKELARNIAMITNEGAKGIFSSEDTVEEILESINSYSKPLERDDVYVVFTRDMLYKLGAIKTLGTWDIMKNKKSDSLAPFAPIDCIPTRSTTLQCGEFQLDTISGVLNGQLPLKSVEYVDLTTGKIFKSEDTGLESTTKAIVGQDRNTLINYILFLVNEQDYNNSFVQMYVEGRFDPKYFEEVIVNYPVLRVYRVIPGVEFE